MNLLLMLALAASFHPALADGDSIQGSSEVQEILRSAGVLSKNWGRQDGPPAVGGFCPLPRAQTPDPECPEDCEADEQVQEAQAPEAEPAAEPINAGFKALGPCDSTGKIDGPGKKGDGRYRVLKCDPYEVGLKIQTGYIDAEFTLKRDGTTGKDTLRVSGRVWDKKKNQWSSSADKTFDAHFDGDAEGTIRWNEGGRWKKEGFRDGVSGRGPMVIEFGGGWDHRFKRDS